MHKSRLIALIDALPVYVCHCLLDWVCGIKWQKKWPPTYRINDQPHGSICRPEDFNPVCHIILKGGINYYRGFDEPLLSSDFSTMLQISPSPLYAWGFGTQVSMMDVGMRTP